ncbi:CETN1 [Branchiostoma lanceolatum]|nr:CETN1 [Branchiostoma lanceolatum]
MAAKTFEEFDTDGSGSIETGEIKTALESMGLTPSEGTLKIVVDRCDKNGDGKISQTEFTRLVKVLEEIKGLRQMFDEIDAADVKDGQISVKELVAKSQKFYGREFSDAEAKEMVSAQDLDQDGTLSIDEFLQIMVDRKV